MRYLLIAFFLLSGCAHMSDTQKEMITKFVLDSASKSIGIACDVVTKKCVEDRNPPRD